MELEDIVKKLVGKVTPSGEHNVDKERLENLNTLIDLIETLQDEIIFIARFKDSPAHSESLIGKTADSFITEQKARFI